MPEIPAESLFDLNQWQKIQNLFAEIIGANLWLMDVRRNCLTQPTKINTCCCDLISSYASIHPTDCVLKAQQNSNRLIYRCPHFLNFFAVPVQHHSDSVAFIVCGPFILGKREQDSVYKNIARQHDIDTLVFLDWIREIKIFSQRGFNLVVNFLTELSHGLLTSKSQSHFTLKTIFEVVRQMVDADSGSVLMFHPRQNELHIQFSYGLNPAIVKKEKLPNDGVASWVIAKKEAVLIHEQKTQKIPPDQLKRPEIKSSMVVPIQKDNQVLGVICLNSNSLNSRFNENNISRVQDLGRLISFQTALN